MVLTRRKKEPDERLRDWVSRSLFVDGATLIVTAYYHSFGAERLELERSPLPEPFRDQVHEMAPGTFADLLNDGWQVQPWQVS